MTDDHLQQRIGHAERDEAVRLLQQQEREGRIDRVELAQRASRVRAARTRADLLPPFADLPVDPPAALPPAFPPYPGVQQPSAGPGLAAAEGAGPAVDSVDAEGEPYRDIEDEWGAAEEDRSRVPAHQTHNAGVRRRIRTAVSILIVAAVGISWMSQSGSLHRWVPLAAIAIAVTGALVMRILGHMKDTES